MDLCLILPWRLFVDLPASSLTRPRYLSQLCQAMGRSNPNNNQGGLFIGDEMPMMAAMGLPQSLQSEGRDWLVNINLTMKPVAELK